MMDRIYVELLDEGLQVWRPVSARHVSGDIYQIIDDGTYDADHEKWMFLPGTKVAGISKQLSDGKYLVAVALANETKGEDPAI